MAFGQILFSLAALTIILGAVGSLCLAAIASVRQAFERMGAVTGFTDAVLQWPGALQRLAVGDPRTLGRADEVAQVLSRDPSLIGPAITAMTCHIPILAARAAHALERGTATHPDLLAEHSTEILELMEPQPHAEVRWRVARMLPRLMLNPTQRERAIELLARYSRDSNGLVTNAAMKALQEIEEKATS